MSKVFAVKRTCIVREGFALDSERRGVLQKGQDVEALELRENEEGATRVRIERGWVSLCTPSGRVVLEPLGGAPPAAGGADSVGAAADSPSALVPDELKDESAKGESHVATPVRFVRALASVGVVEEPGSEAGAVGTLEEGEEAEVLESRAAAGSVWRRLECTSSSVTGWASDCAAGGAPRFEVLLPIEMEAWAVEWEAIPEAPFASLSEVPRTPGARPARPGAEPAVLELRGQAQDTPLDDSELADDGVWLYAEATAVADVPFPPKTLFLLDMLRSPGHNRDVETVRARRRALSAWLQAVHRLHPEDETVRKFFAQMEGDRIQTRMFEFGAARTKRSGEDEHVVYTIKCTGDEGREWTVHKRFSEFSQLRDTLLKEHGSSDTSPAQPATDEADDVSDGESSGDGDAGAGVAAAVPSRYRSIMGAVMREGPAMDSDRVGVLKKGQIVTALEQHQLDSGVVRVRVGEGWVSMTDQTLTQTILSPLAAGEEGGEEAEGSGDDDDDDDDEDEEEQEQEQDEGAGVRGPIASVRIASTTTDKEGTVYGPLLSRAAATTLFAAVFGRYATGSLPFAAAFPIPDSRRRKHRKNGEEKREKWARKSLKKS